MITNRGSNRPSSVQQLQNIEEIFKIFKEPFYKDLSVGEDNLTDLGSNKTKRVIELYKKFIELSAERKVEFYNDFITKCWDYLKLQQEKIDDDPQSNQAKLIKLNIDEQLQILQTFKKFLIKKDIFPESSNSNSLPYSINSLLISGTPIAIKSLTSSDSIKEITNSSLQRVADTSRNYSYSGFQSKIINDLCDMKNISNPRDNLFFKKYLLKHLELVDLYQKQNNKLKDKYNEKFHKYKNNARENCLNYLLSITNPNSQQNFNLDLGNILPSEHNKRYLEELKKLKAKLKGLNYEDNSKRKLDEFLSNEISKVNIELAKVGINSTRSNDSLVGTRSLENYPEREVTTHRRSNLLARFLRGDVDPDKIVLSQIPTNHPNKPVAFILRRRLSKEIFDPLKTIRNSR